MSVLDRDERPGVVETAERVEPPYPPHFVKESAYPAGVRRISTDRYFKPEFHELEVERIWQKCWQWACREEEIPDVGDYYLYKVADLSFIVVRTAADTIKAYPNACLHRGRKLCDHPGKKAEEFRCMFHGWAWNIDGTMKDMTCGWDFPGVRDEVTHLPECKVGTWGGFVFINPDPDAESLESFLGELPEHFEGAGHDFSKRWKQVHVSVDLPVNWKVVQEAFLEAWHVTYTHPQMVRSPEHSYAKGVRWDAFGNFIRLAASLPGDTQKAMASWAVIGDTEQQVLDYYYDYNDNEVSPYKLKEGQTSGQFFGHEQREAIRKAIGDAVDSYSSAHMHTGEMLCLFPNFHPWGGFSRIIYRFRPLGHDPEKSVMDVLLMSPWPEDKPRPPPAPVHHLTIDQNITDAIELGSLSRIFAQDLGNIREVQEGVRNLRRGYVLSSSNNEAPVRMFHDLYDKWMGLGDPYGHLGTDSQNPGVEPK